MRLCNALNHPHIAQVYGFAHEDGVRAIVMELVEGPTLAERIARGPVVLDEALPIATQLAEALEWVQDVPSGTPHAVTPESAGGVTASPDGRSVAVVTEDSRLMVFPLDGGEPRALGTAAPRETFSHWSDDGRTLYLSRLFSTKAEVFAMDPKPGTRRLWKSFELPDPAGSMIFNFVMTPDGRHYAYTYLRWLEELYVVAGLK